MDEKKFDKSSFHTRNQWPGKPREEANLAAGKLRSLEDPRCCTLRDRLSLLRPLCPRRASLGALVTATDEPRCSIATKSSTCIDGGLEVLGGRLRKGSFDPGGPLDRPRVGATISLSLLNGSCCCCESCSFLVNVLLCRFNWSSVAVDFLASREVSSLDRSKDL